MADYACTIDQATLEAALPEAPAPAAAVPALASPRARAAAGNGVAAANAGTPSPRWLVRGKWHKKDMPRERLIEEGPGVLSDTEMIALVLGTGLPGHDVFDVARTLLDRFGSLREMLDATYSDFDGLRGIGPAKKAQLLAIMEMARRSLVDKMRGRSLMNSPEAVQDYLRLRIGGRPQEVFVSLFLDARHRLIRCEESARGTLTRMAVYPREIVRRALSLNAASLIVAHNHPSGAVQPSASDCRLTHTLRDALALIDVRLIDHLVIGADNTYSFARAGWP
ncbi:DNA repair protein RadC [Paraburkholderia sp. RP-4-7]|uniref:DNA repair protein RadC n=1 Tax=Paraburkholderia polaris TaxID=2728848 RepID=A0A848IIW2_9BURK|nr:DNA repair protein RadC [Paraburkholderia polaris]NMM02288.1 DNA repair protein RadC [Paraburkholderia polaris]